MILVAGDAMVDRYWFGDVTEVGPEAPVPVCRIIRTEEREGGAANVANNAQAMGAEVRRLFSPSKEKVVKIRVIGRSQQMARVDFDVPQQMIDAESFMEALEGVSVVVLSDYGKGALVNIRNLIEMAKGAGKTVLVDPKGHDYRRYRGADMVKPNVHEMRELVGGWYDEEELTEKAMRVMDEEGIGAILLTRAQDGMTLYQPGSRSQIAARAAEVYDVSGAGDTAIAAFAFSVHFGGTFQEAALLANRAAGIAVAHFGTYVVTRWDLDK